MLAVLVVCEWSYLCWGQSVTTKGSTRSINRDDFITYEWVDLHSGAYFEQVVEYLKGLLDKEGMVLDEAGKEECQAVFLQALKLEEEFFDNAFT
jgi:thiaminase/transcriptional activator TenA